MLLCWIGACPSVVSNVLGRWLSTYDELLLGSTVLVDKMLLYLVFLRYYLSLLTAFHIVIIVQVRALSVHIHFTWLNLGYSVSLFKLGNFSSILVFMIEERTLSSGVHTRFALVYFFKSISMCGAHILCWVQLN